MKAVFVAGTDTEVGKTIVTGLLARFFCEKGFKVSTQKWVQTGKGRDVERHLKIMGRTPKGLNSLRGLMQPYQFRFPCSPHLAARLEGKRVELRKIRKSFRELSKRTDIVIVEGSGGLLVPLNHNELFIDAVKKLKLPVLLVAGNKLGAINHTLLALEALKTRKIKVLGLVLNNLSKGQSLQVLKDNPGIISRFSQEKILAVLPFSRDLAKLYEYFKPAGRAVLKRL